MLNSPDRLNANLVVKEIRNVGKTKLKQDKINHQETKQDSIEQDESEDKLDRFIRKSDELAHQLNDKLITILANTQLVFLMIGKEDLRTYLSFVEEAARESGDMLQKFQGLIKEIELLRNSRKE